MKFYITCIMVSSLVTFNLWAVENQKTITIGFSTMNFDYQEFKVNGRQLNHEQGFLPGITVQLEKQFEQNTLSATVNYHANQVTYQGETQSGQLLTTDTDEKIFDFAFQISQLLKKNHFFHFKLILVSVITDGSDILYRRQLS